LSRVREPLTRQYTPPSGSAAQAGAALEEVRPGVFAYVQRGGWGFSNAGLIADSGSSLLVDTLYDLRLTERMLLAMRQATAAARHIDVVVNTHANGDHCWGNQLVKDARIISSRRAAREMRQLPPRAMAALVRVARVFARDGLAQNLLQALGKLGVSRAAALAEAAPFIAANFGEFAFEEVSLTLPTETFDGTRRLRVGTKAVQLIEVGPAHTAGDVLVHVVPDRVAYTGDILFIGSHPIMWEGPVENWIAACRRLLDLDVDIIVPGHGPLTDKSGVQRTLEYWEKLVDVCKRGLDSGAARDEVARELVETAYAGWTERSRIVVNIDSICRQLKGDRARRDPLALLAAMARFERRSAAPA
jgi:glyoxylase-like metal-dependent hydrolase (beta-lactamase superfamily II)